MPSSVEEIAVSQSKQLTWIPSNCCYALDILMYCQTGTTARRHPCTKAHNRVFFSFVPNWGRRLALSFCHVILSSSTKTPPHSFSLLELQFMLRDMKAAFTLSWSVENGTQTQEINPQWQSVIHHFHHFSCDKKKGGGKGEGGALYSLHFDKQAHSHFLCHLW